MQSSFKASQELPIAYRVTLHRKESCQTLNLQRLLPCLLGQFPAPRLKSFARMQHNNQAADKGKAEGQWQTKMTVCLFPVFVKIWYAVGKVLLPMRFNFPVRNCIYLFKTPHWPGSGQMWRFIFPVSWPCRSHWIPVATHWISLVDKTVSQWVSLISCWSNWGYTAAVLSDPFWDIQDNPNFASESQQPWPQLISTELRYKWMTIYRANFSGVQSAFSIYCAIIESFA